MEAAEFVRLERIAKNLPVWPGTLKLGYVETEHGPVYMAVGRGHTKEPGFGPVCWHGVYAINYGEIKGMARTAQIPGKVSLKEAQEVLVNDAFWFLEQMALRQMNDRSYNLAGPSHALRFRQ